MPDKNRRRKLQDPEVVRQLAAALLSGATLSESLKQVGVSESTYYRELRRSPELQGALGPDRQTVVTDTEGKSIEPGQSGEDRPTDAALPAATEHAPQATPGAEAKKRGAEAKRDGGSRKEAKRAKRASTKAPKPPSAESVPGELQPPPATRPVAPDQPVGAAEEPKAVPPEKRTAPPDATPPPAVAASVAVAIESPAVAADPVVPAPPAAPVAPEYQRLSRLVRDPYTIEGAAAAASARRRRKGRRSTPALTGADWMPPLIVLVLQLIVAVAVGASLLVIGLIVLTCLGLFLVIRRTRRAAPPETPAPLSIGEDSSTESVGADPNRRPMDLRWVASTIQPSGRPSDDRNPPPQRG